MSLISSIDDLFTRNILQSGTATRSVPCSSPRHQTPFHLLHPSSSSLSSFRHYSTTHPRPAKPSVFEDRLRVSNRAYSTKAPPLSPTSTSTSQTSSMPLPSPSEPKLTHLTPTSTVYMVPISHKSPTSRTATAVCTLYFSNPTALPLIRSNALKKGDVLGVARIAGIMAAKKTR